MLSSAVQEESLNCWYLIFIGWTNFILSWVEHEKKFYNLGSWFHRFPVWIYHSEDHDYYGLPIHGNTGSKIGIDAGGPTVTPDTRTFTPDPVREQACIDLLGRILPSVSTELYYY